MDQRDRYKGGNNHVQRATGNKKAINLKSK